MHLVRSFTDLLGLALLTVLSLAFPLLLLTTLLDVLGGALIAGCGFTHSEIIQIDLIVIFQSYTCSKMFHSEDDSWSPT